jgi:hypothetical protein
MNENKLIVTALLDKLSENEFLRRMKKLIKAQQDFPAIVPNLKPTADDEEAKTVKMDQLFGIRDGLKAQQKANTGLIRDLIKEMKNDVTSKWCSQVQDAVADDKNKVKQLALGIKGEDDLQSEPEFNVTNSHPEILSIDINSPLTHILFLRNNKTGQRGLLPDARDIEVYGFIGAEPPADYKKMTYLGRATRGKFTNRFAADQVGQTIWYFAIYVPRKKSIVAETASKVKAIVM